MKIILGSQSKGRKMVLEEMGFKFEVMASGFDEKLIRSKDPKELTLSLARAKAEALLDKISDSAILITSDQVVLCNGDIREKPESENQAKEFLRSYNKFPAKTVTAVCVTNTKTKKQASGIDIATVYFIPFSEQEIKQIVKEGRVFNLGGGFTVDKQLGDYWERHILKIDGTKDSVLGLPKELTQKLLREVE